jgi:hypothetical protein
LSTKHESLVEAASVAIENVFGDTSVDAGQMRTSLEELRDEIDEKLDTLPEED